MYRVLISMITIAVATLINSIEGFRGFCFIIVTVTVVIVIVIN